MPVPTLISELSTAANSNSPAGSESPIDGDNYLRVHAAFIAQLNANKLDKAGTVAATANQPMGGFQHTAAAAATAAGQYLIWGQRLPASAGTVGAPSITFAGDLDTGVYHIAADTMGFATGGAEQFRVTPAGSAGLGTATPNKLTVDRAFTVNGATNSALEVAAGDVSIGWMFGNASRLTMESNGAVPITFNVNGAERLRIDAAGNMLPSLASSPPSLSVNQQMVFNLTSDTNLRISVRGSDGVTRVANITLA